MRKNILSLMALVKFAQLMKLYKMVHAKEMTLLVG